MINRITSVILASSIVLAAVVADDGGDYPSGRRASGSASALPWNGKSGAENSLVGIALYDSGSKIIRLYGSPDEIQAVVIGGSNNGGGGGGGGANAPRAAGGGQGRAGQGGPSGTAQAEWTGPDFIGDPFDVGTSLNQQNGDFSGGPKKGNGGGGGGGAPSAPSSSGQQGGAGGGSSTTEEVTFTRWVYKRRTVRYGFVLDNHNKVVQIETIGLEDAKSHTKRGVKFGSTFGDIMKRYADPDGYEITGDNLVVRYLNKSKVAFRLSRLKAGDKQRVTGIVVAAGKR